MIKIEHLKKAFGDSVILEDVNLEINKGESIVIIGGSGCGKSTLLRCINRLNEPTAGAIYYDGENILDPSLDINLYRQKVGMVYQHFNLFSHLNVLENLVLTPMTVLKMPLEEATKKAFELLKKVGMENSAYKMPSALSGGQKQRVSIARTLMMNPEVILFDEPTSALDPTMVDEVESVIRNLIDEGLTSIIVTHEMRFAKSIASKVIFLAEKGIYETGTPEEIFDYPDKPLTRQFIYRSRLLELKVDKDNFDLYATQSEIQKFLSSYGLTAKQRKVIEYSLEEVAYPITVIDNNVNEMTINVFGSETGLNHRLVFESPANVNLLEQVEIDEYGLTILKKEAINVSNTLNEFGNNVTIIEF